MNSFLPTVGHDPLTTHCPLVNAGQILRSATGNYMGRLFTAELAQKYTKEMNEATANRIPPP